MLSEIEKKSISLLKYALNDCEEIFIDLSAEEYNVIFDELQQQTVVALLAPIYKNLPNVPEELLVKWKREILRQAYYYIQYNYIQKRITDALHKRNISFVILKGTSASCYYPHPEYRAMGDIDIITKREDIDKACSVLEEIGYKRLHLENDFGRTIKLVKEEVEVEIHKYYASLNDPEKAEYLDNLILDHICFEEIRLPDNVNGLVLLEHIGDHLEHGLGLRQIVDWMMYVRNCLDDYSWGAWFQKEAQKIGLEKLAIVVTRMCQKYLGLEENINWCRDGDEDICRQLMTYIMASGNFGRKESKNIQRKATIEAMTNNQSFFQVLKLLQKYGENNWDLLKKYGFLKPFAWIYQICHSIKKRLANKISAGEVYSEFKESKQRKKLFDELEVKQYKKGLAVLKGNRFEVE